MGSLSEPWDRPLIPKRGNVSQRVLFESVGRALMAWEEVEASLAHIYSALTRGTRFHAQANREYGIPDNFAQRLRGLEVKACRYFVHNPCQKTEGEFSEVVRLAVAYSARRNDIAHGVTRYIHWIVNPGSQESLLGLAGIGTLQWCVIPPHFKGNKFTKRNRPSYVLTSREINRFAASFWDVARHASNFAHDLEKQQQDALAALLGKPTQQDA
jgi:hypothetical protein